MTNRRLLFILFIFLLPLVLVISQCNLFSDGEPDDPRGPQYAGAKACAKCHSDVYTDYLHTAHFLSTREATDSNMMADFRLGHNSFSFSDSLKVVMEKKADGMYQTGYVNGRKIGSAKFDITFGGVKAETYLYWKDSMLYQLPISYFANLHSWTNSPGYDTTRIDFGRLIGKRCFECHASYIKELPFKTQSLNATVGFDKATLINGIDCERCHGPAKQHVQFHTDNPGEKKSQYITRYASLSRQQRLDLCASCHSGNSNMVLRSMFAFKPGDTLANFIEQDLLPVRTDASQLDVHGNQSQMLAASKCFVSKMDCATCHNSHKTERGAVAMFSQRCLSCHNTGGHSACKMASKLGVAIQQNCIDCHMPLRPSGIIAVQTAQNNRATPYMVRNHRIAIYPEEVENVAAFLNKNKNAE